MEINVKCSTIMQINLLHYIGIYNKALFMNSIVIQQIVNVRVYEKIIFDFLNIKVKKLKISKLYLKIDYGLESTKIIEHYIL